VKLIQVGLGGWGRSWARGVLPAVAEIKPVAYVEPHEENRLKAQSELKTESNRFFSTLEEAVATADADAVLITTPVGSHVPLGMAALAAGKHVMIEKPLALNADVARPLAESAEAAGLIAMVSQNYRYFPAPLKAAHLVRSRALGRPQQISVEFRRNLSTHSPAHFLLAQPLLVDMAIHHFDLMRMVLQDEAVEVFCRTWNPPGSPYQEAPAGTAIIRFAGGVMVTYQGNWVSTGKPTYWAGDWRIECDEGEIAWTSRAGGAFGPKRDRLIIKQPKRRAERIPLQPDALTGRAAGLRAFARAIESGELSPFASTARDNLGSIRLMEAMVRSAELGEPIHPPTD
jgi:predicted dehydrogenase